MNTPPPPPPRPLNPVNDPVDVALGAKLREVMQERHISVLALSKATGLTRQTIMRSIEGTRSLDMRQFDKIAQAIGIPHEDLIRGIRAA
jgi:transcriptional regulator with XRE-family HTH domain